MANFFISYSHSNRTLLDDLIIQMRNVFPEKDLWFDEAIPGGAEWWTLILTEIDKCDLFIFLLSEAAANSEYCQKEFRHALDLKKRFLPIKVGEFTSEYPGEIEADLSKILKARSHFKNASPS